MPVLNQFIYKFKLDSKLDYNLFLFGLLAKIFIIIIFSSALSDDLFFPFVNYFVESNLDNPYKFFFNEPLEPFPYPLGMLYILSAPVFFLKVISAFDLTSWIIKIPILLCDILLFYVIKSWLNHKSITKLIIFYWLSPVLFYISYFFGQLDIIPISILFLSLYFLFKNHLNKSAIFLGLALSTKTVIAIIVPFLLVFLISQRQQFFKILLYLILLTLTFILINYPFLTNYYFIEMVFNNSTQGKVFESSITLSSTKIYLLPIAYIFLFFSSLYIRNLNKNSFLTFLGFAMGIFLVFTAPSEGWFFWFLPFLLYFQVKNNLDSNFLIISLQIAYFMYFILSPTYPPDNLTLITSDYSYLRNLFHSILIALLLLSCYWIYRYGILNLANQKIFSKPYMVGIGGNSGSGKTKLSKSLVSIFGNNHALILNGDDLHKWERGDENWTKFTHLDPRANELHMELNSLRDLLNGKSIYRRKYNHQSGTFDYPKKINSANIILYEGLHPFFIKTQREVFDLKIFLNPSKSLNEFWKINRDSNERGKDETEVIKQIKNREFDSDAYILSQEKFANIIIEPICEDNVFDAGPTKYRLIFSNSLSLNSFINFFDSYDHVVLEHEYIDNDMQELIISGNPSLEIIEEFLRENILELTELGILNSKVESSVYGLMILAITFLIFQGAKSE